MKKPSTQFGLAFACLAALLLPACGFGGPSQPPDPIIFSITTPGLDTATLGTDYSLTLETVNGTDPLTWEIISGDLPLDIIFDTDTGVFSGIPADIGNTTLIIQVTDSSDPVQTTAAAFLFSVVSSTAGNAVAMSRRDLGTAANGESTSASLSLDGSFVSYSTDATNLATTLTDTNGFLDIVVSRCRNPDTDCIPIGDRVSLGPVDPDTTEPVEGDGPSTHSAISGDGRFVAFASLATNFITNDTNNAWDIYLRDTCLGIDPADCTPTTTRVSVDSTGAEATGDSVEPVISSDGRFIAFRSLANNLVGGDTNGAGDIFVRDTCLGVAIGCTPDTVRVSVASDGSEATGISLRPAISPDGRFVAFESLATNLVTGDANGAVDIFVRDTCLGAGIGCVPVTVRASLAHDGSESNGNSFQTSVSGGGRFVAFESAATNLITGDTNGFSDAFLRDTCLGVVGCTPTTTRISLDEDGAEFPSISGDPSIDSVGRFIVFTVLPAGLADGDLNIASEIYVRDTCEGGPVDCVPMTTLVSLGPAGERVNGDCSHPVISPDGTAVVFQSSATNLIAADTNNRIDIFLVDLVELFTPPDP